MRFYSTYEELKLRLLIVSFVGTLGFYSTYEELKLYIFKLFAKNDFLFLQYLWGIETD